MLWIDFVNVGYGDCILIREEADRQAVFTMLVDCGDVEIPMPSGSRRVYAADYLASLGIDKLDLLVLTHLHLDHVGGLERLLEKVRVSRFWTNHLPDRDLWGKELTSREILSAGAENLRLAYNIYSRCLAKMDAAGTEIRLLQNSFEKQERPGPGKLALMAFCPVPSLYAKQDEIWQQAVRSGAKDAALAELDSWINDTSIRLRLVWQGIGIELPGDMGTDCWSCSNPESCHILKLPHHGHRNCVTKALLEQMSPRYAVISVSGDRPDDCPAASTLALLEAQGISVLFTDRVKGAPAWEAVRFALKEGEAIALSSGEGQTGQSAGA